MVGVSCFLFALFAFTPPVLPAFIASLPGNFTYRLSPSKSHPWISKALRVDSAGKVSLNTLPKLLPESFLLYVDAYGIGSDGLTPHFDYVSFPITLVKEEETDEDVKFGFEKSIDDVFASLLLPKSPFCLQSSEILVDIFQLLPSTLRNECEIKLKFVPGSEHYFAIEGRHVVARRDWCLFNEAWEGGLKVRLKCEKKIPWTQFIHFVIHRGGHKGQFHHGSRARRSETRNNPPFFEQSLYITSVPEEQPAGIPVTAISANDDEGGVLSYSMMSLLDARSQEFFSVDPKSGIVSTIERLDREKMDVHYFRIVATDSGIPPRTGTATLQINVVDVNDHDPVFEQTSYSNSIREGLPVGSTVFSVRATDEDSDKNGDIFYSILNVHDIDDAFRIDPSSGGITTKLPLDRERRDEYSIIIQASDLASAQVERRTATTTLRIEVLDDNDNYPQWTQRSYNVSVPENFDASNYPVIARVSAVDADEGVNGALRYSIIGGNNGNHFSIDSLTGEVALIKSLDYEAQRSFRLNIRAIDNGNPSRSNNTQLVVSVVDVNDNSPRFYSPIFQETVQENVPVGSSVVRIQAFDPDDGPNAKIQYRLSYREPSDLFPFNVDPDSGWITTAKELDRETQSRYDFDVVASDSGDSNTLSATATVLITVQDLNDNDPKFAQKIYETTVSEQDSPGTPVETLKATDPDENSRLTFEIAEGNVRNRFSVSTQNGAGVLTVAQPLDFKLERKFVLTVKATDSGGRFDLATVYIDIQDANTLAPVFLNTPYSVKLFEDVGVGTTVLTVQATDGDSGLNSQILYSFVEDGDRDKEGKDSFMIDSQTGAITTTAVLDREKVSGYILTVSARDKGIPPMTDTTDVEIVLNDVNDNAPVFERDFYQAKVSEDVPIGTSILQVQASDIDQGRNSIVRYSFSTFSDGDGTFSVDGASGIIRTVKNLDRESVSRYELMVLAMDQGTPQLTGRTNVTITILDINDSPPIFESDRIRFFIAENSPLGSTVGSLTAYDPDEGPNAHVLYSIVGGVDANSFTLVTHQSPAGGQGIGSAEILTRIELDFESPRKKYDLIVRAASPPLRNDVHIEIHVTDKNDNAPFIQPQFSVILNNYKDSFPIGPVGRIPAFDADVTDELKYKILNGNKANLVYLNESTGLLTLSPYLDTNVALTAHMDILVSDGLNEVRSEMILQTRMVTDEMLFNSVQVQLAGMTTEAFLSPLFSHFTHSLAVVLNTEKENIVVFSVLEEIEGKVLNVSFSARRSGSEEFLSPEYVKERVFLNRGTLSKLSTTEVLPFADDLCLLEPCPNFEECLTVLKFKNASGFITSDSMLFRSIHPWQTFACRCPSGFTGLKEHYLCDAEVNLCFSSPCRNGGTCFRKERSFSCVCPPAFTGPHCEIQLEMDTCQPGICSRGSTCTPRPRGGFLCQNCSRGDFVNTLCELKARSFSRGAFLAFPAIKSRYRWSAKVKFATQQRNGLLLYNGRFNDRYDFFSLQVLNSKVRFSFSLGSPNVTVVETGKLVSDGLWHTAIISFFNKTGTLSVDSCDVSLTLQHPEEFPFQKTCAGRGREVLEPRCEFFTESCQRFLDVTGPLYVGGLPTSSSQIETNEFNGCISDLHIDHKFVDLNNYVMEEGTAAGCPEKKSFCASQPCKNNGKCVEGWGTFRCLCPDGFGQKDCSQDGKPVWNLRDERSSLLFTPQLRPIQFPWYNSISVRTLAKVGSLFTIRLSNNESLELSFDGGVIALHIEGTSVPASLPKLNDGHWHNIELKWMTAEIWFSLDYGQFEVTLPLEVKVQGLYVSQVIVGNNERENSFSGCVQDVRVGSGKSYLRKANSEKNVGEGCSLATACVGATCPPRSTCIEEGGKHKCECDPGYVGLHCLPICDLRPCKNNGTCSIDLSLPREYSCKCDERNWRGNNCEENVEATCPSTWWGWPVCGPCNCPADKNYSPECGKRTGECVCRENHYERAGSCHPCNCYAPGSLTKKCEEGGKCGCRAGVTGPRCDTCTHPLAEVTTNGCELVSDGCPRAYAQNVWWGRTKFGSTAVHDCPSGGVGLGTRECLEGGWIQPDLFNCTSSHFLTLLQVVGELESGGLVLSPLLSTKLAGDLSKAVNGSELFGNDVWVGLRLLTRLINAELAEEGLNLSHRQDKNFINNLAVAAGKLTHKELREHWQKIEINFGVGADAILRLFDSYLAHLAIHQEDTFTNPFEIITPQLIFGLDKISRKEDEDKNFEDLYIESSYDLYEVNRVKKRAVRFPKYDNIVWDSNRYSSPINFIIPLDLLGLENELDMAGNAVVGYIEYKSLWDVIPKKFGNDVERRFNSELFAYPPLLTLSILASRVGIRSGPQTSPVRITWEMRGTYAAAASPQCVVWEEEGWTARDCRTDVEEAFVGNVEVVRVNCTCFHLSTFAVLIERGDADDVPRPKILEDVVSYVAFTVSLLLIFGALVALGLLKGPIPATVTNTIHKHLLLCLFCSIALYFVALKGRVSLVGAELPCRTIAMGLHFFWLASFSWLLSSALHLCRTFTEVRDVNHGSAIAYFAIGYAFPALCVSLSLGIRAHHYGNKFFCWLSLYEGIVWGMVGPVLLTVLASLATFLVAVKAAFTFKDQVVDSGNMRTLLWMDLTMLPLSGMVWALSLLGANERNPTWQYAVSVAVTVLALYISLGYCILNQRVKESLFIRAGNLFRPREEIQPNITRSALAYRTSEEGVRAEEVRRERFRGARSFGVSTASTTSRSTTKTSSSPYRSDGFNSGHTPNLEESRFLRDRFDSGRRRRRKDEEERSSEGEEQTLELASSHTSDEEEAITTPHLRTLDARNGVGGRSSGSDNENSPGNHSNNSPPIAGPQEYVQQPEESPYFLHSNIMNSSEKFPFQEPANDLSGSSVVIGGMSPNDHSTPHVGTYFTRQPESPISPLHELPDEGDAEERGVDNEGLDVGEEGEKEIYGGSITSGVLV